MKTAIIIFLFLLLMVIGFGAAGYVWTECRQNNSVLYCLKVVS